MNLPKLKNAYKVFLDQLPLKRLLRNIWKGHLYGVFSMRSHLRDNGKPKIMYNTKATAIKSAKAMFEKHDKHFSNYKCLWCDGYHIGKNRDNK